MTLKTKKAEDNEPPEIPPIVKKRMEEKQVQERVAIGAHVVHETILREGEEELKRPPSALAWSGLAEGLLASYLPNSQWRPLLSKIGYSVGFLIVVLGRQQLFTETTLTAVLPLLSRRDVKTGLSVLRLWSMVLLSNLVGTYLFALAIARIPIFSPEIQRVL